VQKAVLDKALTNTYLKKGITKDPKTNKYKPPIMQDLLEELQDLSTTVKGSEAETYRSLINRIEMYVTGVFSFLNRQTQINFNNRFVCFNVGDMPAQVKPVVMFLILDYVYMKMKKDKERKMLVIDEAWSLLQRSEDEGYILQIVKTCRKFNLGLLLITQDVGDLFGSKAGKAILNNSEYTLLLRQKPSIIEQVSHTFKLSELEREHLLQAQTGEGILIMGNDHNEIKVVSSPEEHEVITTNADEQNAKKQQTTEEPTGYVDYNLKVDGKTGIYKDKELTKEDKEFLKAKSYIISEHVGLYGGRRETYWLKPRSNESPEHFFVTKAIETEIKKHTDKVWLYATVKPDIIFETPQGKKIGVEVETGKRLTKDKKVVLEKVRKNNIVYGKDGWFFVPTNVKRDRKKYQKLATSYARKEIAEVMKTYFSTPNLESSNSKNRELEVAKNREKRVQNQPINT